MSDETTNAAPLASVAPIEESIALPEAALALVQMALGEVQDAQLELGAEMERHLNTVAALKNQIDQKREAYVALVDVLAKQHVKRPGKFDFRPDLGAFVRARGTNGSES